MRGGASVRHLSCALGQRDAKRQPTGMFTALGSSPTRKIGAFFRFSFSTGSADLSATE